MSLVLGKNISIFFWNNVQKKGATNSISTLFLNVNRVFKIDYKNIPTRFSILMKYFKNISLFHNMPKSIPILCVS